jgi:hypothetical protein
MTNSTHEVFQSCPKSNQNTFPSSTHLYNDSETYPLFLFFFPNKFFLRALCKAWSRQLRTPSRTSTWLHAFSVEESIRDAFTRPGLSFQSFFLQEIPPLHASESSALSVYYLGNGLHLLAFLLCEGRHAHSFFPFHSRIRSFSFGTGAFCAYDMISCWKWTSTRLEAEGNVQSSRLGSILE